jgi:energy-coupling factor transport system permease protein
MNYGLYEYKNSIVHKLPAIFKIILLLFFSISMFILKNIFYSLSLFIFSILLLLYIRIDFNKIKKTFKYSLIPLFLTFLFYLFTYKFGKILFSFWIFNFTDLGLFNSLFYVLSIFVVILLSLIFCYSTSIQDLYKALLIIIYPLKLVGVDTRVIALSFTLTINFIPIFISQIKITILSFKIKGIKKSAFNIFNFKLISNILSSVLRKSLRYADELSFTLYEKEVLKNESIN